MKVGQPYKLVFPSPSKSQFPSTHLLSKACSFNACVYSEQNLNSLEPDRQPACLSVPWFCLMCTALQGPSWPSLTLRSCNSTHVLYIVVKSVKCYPAMFFLASVAFTHVGSFTWEHPSPTPLHWPSTYLNMKIQYKYDFYQEALADFPPHVRKHFLWVPIKTLSIFRGRWFYFLVLLLFFLWLVF